jgi:SAM-dependent methyltransferase
MDPTFWDERYGTDTYAYGREPNELLREEAKRIPPGPVLCIAEGEGRNAVFLAGLGHDVTAVDFSEQGLAKAARLAEERGVSLTTVRADLATYDPPEGPFSGVVAIFAHLPPAVRKRVHGWIPRVLAPGGVLVLEAYTPAQIPLGTGGPKDPAMTMTLEGLKEELAPLQIVIGREVERDIEEGAFHSGRSATVQVVAVRT